MRIQEEEGEMERRKRKRKKYATQKPYMDLKA